ncbi:MAG: DUF4268 domain-containing protein [Anaerolineae bacterium]|nr:DUF4268 domain-containing protein [Anaerolineae bacterium]
MTESLGRLKRVELRTVWSSESGNFTPWLAQDENLALLSETIGLDLELEATEKNVGVFRADIVCKDTITDSWVLIENQIEPTNHGHLGQLLTYAAGLNAVTIVWIAERIRDEHRAALDWLNEVTAENINFFGLEIELWQIGTSTIAPKFNIVSQPNDWTRLVVESRKEAIEVSPIRQLLLEYWTVFREYLRQNNNPLKGRKPYLRSWYNFSLGRTGFRLSAFVNTREKRLGVRLTMYSPNAKIHFHYLEQQRIEIEAAIGDTMSWKEATKHTSITLRVAGVDPMLKDQWEKQHQWLSEKLELFYRVFRPYLNQMIIYANTYEVTEIEDDE